MTRTRKWYLEFRDHIGIVRRLAGYDDKRMTEKLAEYVQELVNCRAVGVSPDVKVGQWLESVSVRILAKLVEWGLVDGERMETTKPLADHIDDYSRVLGNRQRSRDYAVRVPNRLRKIVQACRFVYLPRCHENQCGGAPAEAEDGRHEGHDRTVTMRMRSRAF